MTGRATLGSRQIDVQTHSQTETDRLRDGVSEGGTELRRNEEREGGRYKVHTHPDGHMHPYRRTARQTEGRTVREKQQRQHQVLIKRHSFKYNYKILRQYLK